jgi:hypothetical protein
MFEHLVEIEQLSADPAFLWQVEKGRFQLTIHYPNRMINPGMALAALPLGRYEFHFRQL